MKKNIILTTICPDEADIQLGLYSLKAYFLKRSAKAAAVNISVLPFSENEKTKDIAGKLLDKNPDVIGFSCYVWNITATLKVSKAVKAGNKGIKIWLGGPEVSPRARGILRRYPFVDAVVIGEGEEVFKELLERHLDNCTHMEDIKGIAYRLRNRVVVTAKRPDISNLDDIPSPYLAGVVDFTIRDYSPYVPVETHRGCVYRCHYCYYHKEFQGIRYFPLERVERELSYILKRKPRGVFIMDPTFNLNRSRAKEILRIFIRHNKKSNLRVELRAELLDREMVDLLAKAKADYIEIGIQSTNPKTLKRINRPFEPRAFRKNILLLNKKNIFYEIQLIDGLPADSYKTLAKAVDWILELRPRMIKIMRLMLLPGTYLRQHAADFNIGYNPRPQYYSTHSDTFSREDLKKTETLRYCMDILYDQGLLNGSLYRLRGRLDIKFTDVFHSWFEWMRREHKDLIDAPKVKLGEDPRILKAIQVFRSVKTAGLSADFVKFLCRKRGRQADASLLRLVERDRKNFLQKSNIKVVRQ